MGVPYCIYRTVTPETIADVIAEELNKLEILCVVETTDTTSDETYNFYGIRLSESNIRLNIYCEKGASPTVAKRLSIGMQATRGYVEPDDNGLNRSLAGIGQSYTNLTMSVFKKSSDFYLIGLVVATSQIQKPSFLAASCFRFGKISIKDSTGEHVVPVCGIHAMANYSTLESSTGWYAFKSINDGNSYRISKSDAVKVSSMEFQPEYNIVSNWGVMVLPAVGYTGTLSALTTPVIPTLPDEIIGIKSIYGSNAPALSPLKIDGKTYIKLSDQYHMAVQID